MSKDLLQNPAKVEATYLLSFRRKNGTHLKRGLFHAFLLVSLTALMFVLPLAGRGHSMGELDASSDCGSAEVSLEYTPALARVTFRVPGCKSLDGSGHLLIRGRLLRSSGLVDEHVDKRVRCKLGRECSLHIRLQHPSVELATYSGEFSYRSTRENVVGSRDLTEDCLSGHMIARCNPRGT